MMRMPRVTIQSLPSPVLGYILSFCDPADRSRAALAARCFSAALAEIETSQHPSDINDNILSLDCLPSDVLLTLFKFLDRPSLGSIAQVCTRFRDISYSDSLWIEASRKALASNQVDPGSLTRSQETLQARDKVRLGLAWQKGKAIESLVAVQNSKYMPRIQLDAKRLWVSWGSRIWCHPRLPDGGIAKTTSRMLRGHSDDVSKFVVSDGMVVSGGRDRALCGWSQHSGQFLFARRYVHGGEITAVDVTARGAVVVTGSRDKNILVWNIQEDPDRDALLPVPVQRTCVEDRVWSVAANELGILAVGTAGTRGVPPLRLYDLATGDNVLDLGTELKNGAGMLDMAWLNNTTFLACGYDTFTRLWDTRCRTYVRSWEEPFDESVYCLATDRVNCLVTGTSRHGRVRVWDMRSSGFLYMKYSAPARRGQSSPVYSMAMDSSNLYVALDQSLNHFGFSGTDPKIQRRNRRF
jgi:F-box/WD-40 domain protein 4